VEPLAWPVNTGSADFASHAAKTQAAADGFAVDRMAAIC